MPETASPLKARITEDMKTAMRSGEKERLATIRLVLAAIKQVEVDTRSALTDDDLLPLLDKMCKQRRESIEQFEQAGRDDLASKERQELEIIQDYLPAQLSEAEIAQLIDEAIAQTGAESVRDMGKVMGIIKPRAQGRADMAAVSALIKARLSA
ncbi:MAG: GatB/YqeY domain-containing protein [Gammaproteobacteria bacterium]|nr:GatB/YqeY domain-containing protein [Gammaproteobacteria bacterium]MDX5375367.1 GatB/YqeY domain-containing protein [Gammaproteobacteria bacterium]